MFILRTLTDETHLAVRREGMGEREQQPVAACGNNWCGTRRTTHSNRYSFGTRVYYLTFEHQDCIAIWYIASWTHDGLGFTQQFCPVDGKLKPASYAVTKLLMDEGVVIQGPVIGSTNDFASEIEGNGNRCVVC